MLSSASIPCRLRNGEASEPMQPRAVKYIISNMPIRSLSCPYYLFVSFLHLTITCTDLDSIRGASFTVPGCPPSWISTRHMPDNDFFRQNKIEEFKYRPNEVHLDAYRIFSVTRLPYTGCKITTRVFTPSDLGTISCCRNRPLAVDCPLPSVD